jgi:methionine-rich copper-binding protein CopC
MLTRPLRGLAAVLIVGGVAMGSAPAGAHAIIVAAKPTVDATVTGPRLAVELRFNSRIDAARSQLSLVRPDGSTLPLTLAPGAPPDVLSAEAQGLAPGRYRLRWQVLGLDGHITRGDIPFAVAG